MNLPGDHEDGLEADAFLADVALGSSFGALADGADGCEVLLSEAVFIAIHHNAVMQDIERHERCLGQVVGGVVVVVVGVLQQFEDEAGLARVQIRCEPAANVSLQHCAVTHEMEFSYVITLEPILMSFLTQASSILRRRTGSVICWNVSALR